VRGDLRIAYSPMDALKIARANPSKQVVFFGIGFETTAAPNAMTVYQARREAQRNFSMLVSQVLVPPAMRLPSARRRKPRARPHRAGPCAP
jgi:hydrogenase expression/formation protein HypD